MKQRIALQLAFCGLIVGAQAVMAGTAGLADWCVNVNGDTNTACNGAGGGGASPTGANINLSAFDTTHESSGTNNLGTVTITLGAGNNQYANFYADYDLDFATEGSFSDSAMTVNALPPGYSYELNDPTVSNIFGDFTTTPLPDSNNVGTPGTPSSPNGECCDAAFALGIGGINVAAGGSATVTFDVTTIAPASGFYIQQTNEYDGDSIYLQGSVALSGPGGGTGTPEPSTFGLGLIASGAALLYSWKRKRAGLIG